MLSDEGIEDFRRLFFNKYGKRITNEQAIEMGMKLIRLVKVIFGPDLPKEWKIRKFDSVGPKKVR